MCCTNTAIKVVEFKSREECQPEQKVNIHAHRHPRGHESTDRNVVLDSVLTDSEYEHPNMSIPLRA